RRKIVQQQGSGGEMMRYRLIVLFFFICHTVGLHAQLYDKVWMLGWSGWAKELGLNNFSMEIREELDPKMTILDTLNISFFAHSVTMSDERGDSLLFYTNGVTIWNKHNQVMQNGDSLGWGWYLKDNQPNILRDGVSVPEGGVCMPSGKETIFNYVYVYLDSINDYSFCAKKVLLAQIAVAED